MMKLKKQFTQKIPKLKISIKRNMVKIKIKINKLQGNNKFSL